MLRITGTLLSPTFLRFSAAPANPSSSENVPWQKKWQIGHCLAKITKSLSAKQMSDKQKEVKFHLIISILCLCAVLIAIVLQRKGCWQKWSTWESGKKKKTFSPIQEIQIKLILRKKVLEHRNIMSWYARLCYCNPCSISTWLQDSSLLLLGGGTTHSSL